MTERRPDWFLKMRECDGKHHFETKAKAETYVNGLKKREGRSDIATYECTHCKGWHVGHQRVSTR
jgi:hypothetical protein